ncbi:MAG: ATP-binding protein [Nocardioidaceae bacterium]
MVVTVEELGGPTRRRYASTGIGVASRSVHGRQTEIRRLVEAVMGLATGGGRVTLVEGTAGLGKSRLVDVAMSLARVLGIAVARGTSNDLGRPQPMAPLLEALRDSSPPVLGVTDPESAREPDRDRLRLVNDLEATLRRTSADRPVLIALDDMQWADPSTTAAVKTLIGRLAPDPIMWMLCLRPSPSSRTLRALVSDLRASRTTVLQLEPLTSAAVEALATDVTGAPPDGALLALLDKCGGNPYMVMELLSTLAARGELVVDTEGARLRPVGPTIGPHRPLGRLLAAVSPATQQLLAVAAVLGQSFDFAAVASVMNRPVAELVPAVQEAVAADLVVEEGVRLGFPHALVRETLYAGMPLGIRRSLHRKAADALLATGGSILDAAAHAIHGAEAGDLGAARLLMGASDEIAVGDPSRAADLRLGAVDLMPDADDRQQQTLAEAILLLFRAGRSAEAEQLAGTALRAGLPAELEVRIRLRLAEPLADNGLPASALHHVRAALDLPDLETSAKADLCAAESTAHLTSGDLDAALRTGEHAVKFSRTSGSARSTGNALLALGAAERVQGDYSRSLDLVEEAATLLVPNAAEARCAEPRWVRGDTLTALDRFDEASAAFEAALRSEADHKTALMDVFGLACRARLLLHRGNLRSAASEAESGLIRAAELDLWTYTPELNAVLAEASAYLGQFRRARNSLRRGFDLVDDMGGLAAQHLTWATAVVDELAGEDPLRVVKHAAPLYRRDRGQQPDLAFDPMAAPFLVGIAMRAGDEGLATTAAAAADSLSRLNGNVISVVAAGLQAASLLTDDAEGLVEAARAFRSSPRPLSRARADEDAARLLLRGRRNGQAVEHLNSALAGYERSGAVAPAGRVREQLAAVTSISTKQSNQRPKFGWASLTPAELRVARLAATGLTNRDIAAELDLSPHTVESHLRHAFHKLDIRSRVELTRVVLSQERDEPH